MLLCIYPFKYPFNHIKAVVHFTVLQLDFSILTKTVIYQPYAAAAS